MEPQTSQDRSGKTRRRRYNIRALREKNDAGPRLPDFFGTVEAEPKPGETHEAIENVQDMFPVDDLRSPVSPPDNDFSPAFMKPLPQGGFIFVMNKISFISILFGLILIGILLFTAGIMTAYYILPGGPQLMGAAIQGGGTSPVPTLTLPTREDITRSIEKAVGKLGEAPKKKDVHQAIQKAVKSITPKFAEPAVEKIINPPSPVNQEFIQGAKRTPTDNDAGKFTVQAKVYGDGAWAMQLARKLKEKGYGAYLIRVKDRHSPRQTYHTRVGVFGDYMAANTLVRKLKEMGNRSASVVLVARGEKRVMTDDDA